MCDVSEETFKYAQIVSRHMVMRRICGKLATKLLTRKYGMPDGKCIKLKGEEYLYLVEKGVIDDDFVKVFREEAWQEDFDIHYLVYRDLRSRGYTIIVHDDFFRAKKSYSMDFYPVSDMHRFSIHDAINRQKPFVLSVVDGDGDITYYMVDSEEPKGVARQLPAKLIAEVIGHRVVVFENPEILNNTTFGRYEGKFGHLSILEAEYLAEMGIIKSDIKLDDELYIVYKDLRDRGLIVKSGFKYGTHFRVYERSMDEHSRYLVHMIGEVEEMQKISRAVRVAHGVRKDMLFAHVFGDEVRYFLVRWIRP